MVAPACAFGNSFTLPAIFFATLLPPALADRALGYAALFLLAWSPCLWSLGMTLVGGQPAAPKPQRQQERRGGAAAQAAAAAEQQQGGGSGGGLATQEEQQQQSKPLSWRQPRIVDVTPLAVGSSDSLGSADEGASAGCATSSGNGLSEPPAWAEALARHPATARLTQFLSQVMNPPVMAILAGAVVGYSSAGQALLASIQGSGGAAAAALPPELGLVHSLAKAALEVCLLRLLGALCLLCTLCPAGLAVGCTTRLCQQALWATSAPALEARHCWCRPFPCRSLSCWPPARWPPRP